MGHVLVNPIRTSFHLKIFCLSVFVILADILYFKQPLGFLVGVGALSFLAFLTYYNQEASKIAFGKICIYASLGQCFALIYNPNILSFSLYFIGSVCLTFLGKGLYPRNAFIWAKAIGAFLLSIFLKFLGEIDTYTKISSRRARSKMQGKIKLENRLSEILSRWTLPIALSVIFIMLFAAGNPIIGGFLSNLKFKITFPELSYIRFGFWILSGLFFLSFMKPPYVNVSKGLEVSSQVEASWLFNKRSILNSLVIFNVIFLIQTFSDLVYLWGGADLPTGMTYATYAQQGAYPLMVTALLAGIFVLIALRSHNHNEGSSWIKGLIYFWVGQNIFLVVSSILRTQLYIEQYSLTYWRLSALVWMGLVAVGLALIIIRIARDKSNTWLINANATVVMIVLYICSVVNIGSIIANYNVRHCYEVTGQGSRLDEVYLSEEVGTDALPALRWVAGQAPLLDSHYAPGVERVLLDKLYNNTSHWRSWTIREYLLSKEMSDN
jgi:hypothetical protein